MDERRGRREFVGRRGQAGEGGRRTVGLLLGKGVILEIALVETR